MDFNNEKSIYIQLAEWLEDAILSGAFAEESQVPSTTDISVNYRINPATALKGINLLVDGGILYKKRGLGMFVSGGARARILSKRKKLFLEEYVVPMIAEAEKLGIEKKEIIDMIDGGGRK